MIDPSFDPIVKELSVDLIKGIFDATYQGTAKFLKWIEKKEESHDFFGRKARKYVLQLEERYNRVKIFGMNDSIPLRDIFVRANILSKIIERQRKRLDELENHFDWDRRGFGMKKAALPGLDVVNTKLKFIVLGKPGAGKTTFLKRIVLYAIDGELQEKRIPVFISLKNWSESSLSLLEFIINEFKICQFDNAEGFITLHLELGKMLILLDGLDEVSKDAEDAIIKGIKNFSDKYRDNQFILSCRIHAFNAYFEQFSDVEMADFNDFQIQEFIFNWFHKEPKTAENCWDELKNDKQIRELAQIPLMLTLLCIAYDDANEFPPNRADLYTEATSALLKSWDAKRRIKRGEIYKGLSSSRKHSLLSQLAFYAFQEGEYFLSQRKWEKRINDFIINLPEINEQTVDLDSEAILKAIVAQHGIIVPRAKQIYSFSHLTFQEYYTAKYIADRPELIPKMLEDHLLDERWREVFILLSGMIINSDNLLKTIKEWVDNYAIKHNLTTILIRIYEFCPVKVEWEGNRRSLALSYALEYSSYFVEEIEYSLDQILAKSLDNEKNKKTAYKITETLNLNLDSSIEKAGYLDKLVNEAKNLEISFVGNRERSRDIHRQDIRNLIDAHIRRRLVDLQRSNDVISKFPLDGDLEFEQALSMELKKARKRSNTLNNSSEVDHSLVHMLNEKNISILEKYLGLNLLLLQCLEVAHMPSKIMRKKIRQELFMAPEESLKTPSEQKQYPP